LNQDFINIPDAELRVNEFLPNFKYLLYIKKRVYFICTLHMKYKITYFRIKYKCAMTLRIDRMIDFSQFNQKVNDSVTYWLEYFCRI